VYQKDERIKEKQGTHLPHAGEHLRDTAGGDCHADNDVGVVDCAISDGAQAEDERRARKGEEAEGAWNGDARNGQRCGVRIMVAAHFAEGGWDARYGTSEFAVFIKGACHWHILDVSWVTLYRRLRSRVRLP
jgi:hypothetical protein